MSLPLRTPTLSPEEYLRIERASEFRSEYFAGEVFAMTGGSPRHCLIKMNIGAVLRDRLLSQPCTAYDSDLRIKVPTGLYTYPDISVICGSLILDDERGDTVLNPTLIVEVLSPSTEADDRGKKFDHYRRIESLREYVLVSQDFPKIERFLRNEDDTWTLSIASGLETSMELPSIGVSLSLKDAFSKVTFDSLDEMRLERPH